MSITPVTDGRQFEEFIRLPFRLYATDANWVPPLLSSERKMIDPKRNPFYDHAEAVHFLAWKDGRIAGRISAIVNRLHNEFHQEKSGFWGYFECEDDPALACELFDAAAAWLREKGMTRMVGPASPSLNDPCGLLVDGFKWSPFVLMPYNPPFYIKLVNQAGFTKAMDLWAYILVENDLVKERIDRVANAVKNRGHLVIRPMNLDRFTEKSREALGAAPAADTAFLDEARVIVGDAHVTTDPDDLAVYGRDWTRVHVPRASAVILPRTTGEVAAVVRAANRYEVELVPSGGRTGLAAGAVVEVIRLG
jgi:hypothetical protein